MSQQHTVPVVDWFDLAAAEVDPYPQWRRLQEEAPLAFVPALAQQYVVTLHDDVHSVLADPERFHSNTVGDGDHPIVRTLGASLLSLDGPPHAVVKRAVGRATRAQAINKHWLAIFERNADRFVDELLEAGPGADFMSTFAEPYVATVLAEVIGVADAVDHRQVAQWSHQLIAGGANYANDPEITAIASKAAREVDEVVNTVLRDGVNFDEPSIISMTLGAGDVSEEGIRSNVKLVLAGGVNEPRAALGAGLKYFLDHPAQFADVLSGEVEWVKAFDEVLRLSAPITYTGRIAVQDVTIGDIDLPEGAPVLVALAAANRDASIFTNPDAFDIHRPELPAPMTFGGGVHFCSGSWVARASVGKVAWPKIWERIPQIRIAEGTAPTPVGHRFRSYPTLEVEW